MPSDPKDLTPDAALDALYDDAVAGATDQWLAARADVSVAMVRRWKKAVDIKAAQRGLKTVHALRGLAASFEPQRHRTKEHLEFSTPAFVLHEALDYTQYARACFTLEVLASFSTEQIASATGTKPVDVATAVAAWRRHLGKRGKSCLGCDVLLDHRFGAFCSRSCHDRALGRPPLDP